MLTRNLVFAALFLAATTVAGLSWARTQSAGNSCCFPGAICCELNLPCCNGGSCCFEGSPCCYPGSECCEGDHAVTTTTATQPNDVAETPQSSESCGVSCCAKSRK